MNSTHALPAKPTQDDYINHLLTLAQSADEGAQPNVAHTLLMAASVLGAGEMRDLENRLRLPPEYAEISKIPVQSMHELEASYQELSQISDTRCLDLYRWLPSLNIRPLVPGELVVIIADTGVGKTVVAQNLLMQAAPLTSLLFELELPGTVAFERFAQMTTSQTGNAVWQAYKSESGVRWPQEKLQHIWTCDKSGLTPEQIEDIIAKSRDKIGAKPALVVVDYIGLVRGQGSKRYEKVSDAAEQMKVIAKNQGVVLVMISQVARPEDRNELVEPRLHHAKDSGSIESSGGLVIGLWRDEGDHRKLWLKILKHTHGRAGLKIPLRFNVDTMAITELSDKPQPPDWTGEG